MLRILCRLILRTLYKVEVRGLEHYEAAGKRVLIVANHTSFLDAVLLACFMPDKLMFAVNSYIAEKWYFKPFLAMVKAFPLDPTNPMATKSIIKEISKDQKCVIFPEGRITVTGSLMKVYEGPGLIADKSGAIVLPVRIDGAQYSKFSRLKGKVRLRWFPKITLTVLPPLDFEIDENVKGRKRRAVAGIKLYDVMRDMMFETSEYEKTLFESLLDAEMIFGRHHPIIMDVERKELNYNQLIVRSMLLGKLFAKDTNEGEFVGQMLPNSVAAVVSFFALQAFGRVPAMLNFSAGEKNILSACKTGGVRTVLTSRKFIDLGKLDHIINAFDDNQINVIYLEDVAKKITLKDKIIAWNDGKCAKYVFKKINTSKPDDAAVLLFTSGSEGTPKGVVLSHTNIQANRYQLSSVIDFGPSDVVFNALPIFHSFGLTGGTILPILSGLKTFFYPSPLHYRIVPELVYDSNATIMFGTDTFLRGYARFANAYDFYSVRYVFAGAEKLKEETRSAYAEKYGVRIFESYGATETSPGLTTNTPMHNMPGSVGRLLPSVEYKLEAVPGIEGGGRLHVRGANIMKGYFLADNAATLVPPKDGWYDTGDIVEIDAQGFVFIKGRAKRFAKIAGEMVSLTAVETYVSEVWQGFSHAVVAIPDAKKGEQLVLVTDCENVTRPEMSAYAKANGISELSVPRTIKLVDKVPVLGTGKLDYVGVQLMVDEGLAENSA
jgi:acyl-[acyl-carrier-protein]-phospholipid O-acyltransferase/long-chain-fatty-acid--[acyl-carrier-protein] ligase